MTVFCVTYFISFRVILMTWIYCRASKLIINFLELIFMLWRRDVNNFSVRFLSVHAHKYFLKASKAYHAGDLENEKKWKTQSSVTKRVCLIIGNFQLQCQLPRIIFCAQRVVALRKSFSLTRCTFNALLIFSLFIWLWRFVTV